MNQGAQKEQLDSESLRALGLQAQPFADTAMIYEHEDQATRMGIARAALRDGGIVILSGVEGIGKTSFLRHLQAQAHDLAVTIINGNPRLQLGEALESLGAQGGDGMPSEIATILRDADPQPVLAIDDSDALSGSLVKRLVRLQSALADKGLALPLIMACDRAHSESLAGLIEANKHSLVPLQRVALSGLGQLDTNTYLRLRLAEAGGDHTLLDDRQLARIHRRSEGIPRRIHEAAVRELERHAGRKRLPWPSVGLPAWASRLNNPVAGITAAVGGIGAIAIAWWLIPGSPEPERIESDDTVVSADQDTSQGANPNGTDTEDGSSPEPLAKADSDTATEPAGTPVGVDVDGTEANAELPDSREGDGGSNTTAEPPRPETASEPGEDDSGIAGTGDTTPETTDESANPSGQETADSNTDARSTADADASNSDSAADDSDPSADDATDDGQPARSNEEETAKRDEDPPKDTANGASLDLDQEWLAEQSADGFTIQILGAREPATVRRFLGQIEAADETRILRTRHDGGPWYVVVTGAYSERSAASESIAELRSSWREHDPFPRRFDSFTAAD